VTQVPDFEQAERRWRRLGRMHFWLLVPPLAMIAWKLVTSPAIWTPLRGRGGSGEGSSAAHLLLWLLSVTTVAYMLAPLVKFLPMSGSRLRPLPRPPTSGELQVMSVVLRFLALGTLYTTAWLTWQRY
jgi:hypothetical protein